MQANGAIFDPARFADLRRPLLEASTPPGDIYTSEEWYRREVETIFMRDWLMVGRADQIPDPGDWFTEEIVGERVLVVRGADGEIRAFSPACRHRGALVAEGSGNCRAFVCPYHMWTYGLDGRLAGTPHAASIKDMDRDEYGLVPIRLEIWAGFIHINFDPAAPDLLTFLGDLPDKLARYGPEKLRHTRKKTYRLACNWKVYTENSIEVYHLQGVHGASIQEIGPFDTWTIESPDPPAGNYLNLYGTFPGSLGLLAGQAGFPPMAGLGQGNVERHDLPWVLPNNHFLCTADTFWWLTMFPEGPGQTRIEVNSSFPEETVAREDFAEIAERYYERLRVTNGEDNVIAETQQRGLAQRLYRPGRYTEHEVLVHAFVNHVVNRVVGPAP